MIKRKVISRKLIMCVVLSLFVLIFSCSIGFADENVINPQSNVNFVPMRTTFESLGTKIIWNGENQTVTITKDNIILILTVGSNIVYKNGQEFKLDDSDINIVPKIIDDKLYVPTALIDIYNSNNEKYTELQNAPIEPERTFHRASSGGN